MLSSCAQKEPTQDETVRRNAEAHIMEKMNDPASYEFVKLELVDSIVMRDYISSVREGVEFSIESGREQIERLLSYKDDPWRGELSSSDEDNLLRMQERLPKNEKILVGIDSLTDTIGEQVNDVVSYLYFFSFRANNAMGAKILNEYIIQTNAAPDFKIIAMVDDIKDILFDNPDWLPSMTELIEKGRQ